MNQNLPSFSWNKELWLIAISVLNLSLKKLTNYNRMQRDNYDLKKA